MSLLRDCVGGVAGERLLIVSETEGSDFYDSEAPKLTAAAGRALGMRVYCTESASFVTSPEEKQQLFDTLRGFDHIVFFSRVGDQIRFSNDKDMPSATMCYTLNLEALTSEFGTACYQGMCEVKKSLDDAFTAARHIRVTCPRGTDYAGRPNWGDGPSVEVSIKRFPMLVSKPVPAMGLTGRVALSRFLIGTGSCNYEPYYLPLDHDVFACFENNEITRFEGDPQEVDRINKHYYHVSDCLKIEPWVVDSWHAGIHPACQFRHHAQDDILRWSSTAFGNPRILHFHTCGNYAPGEISWNVLDPTIYIDDVPVWESGQLYPERLPNGASLFDHHPNLAALYQNPYREVGLVS